MLNAIAVMGRLVATPELKKTPNGVSTTTFTIACERNYTTQGKERQTDFFDIVAWRGTAEFASKYFQKGQLMAINGSLQTRSYEDKNGNKRKVHEIVADNLHFADSKKSTTTSNDTPSPSPQGEQAGASADDFTEIPEGEDLPFD